MAPHESALLGPQAQSGPSPCSSQHPSWDLEVMVCTPRPVSCLLLGATLLILSKMAREGLRGAHTWTTVQ